MFGLLHLRAQQMARDGFVAGIARGAMEHLFIASTNLFFEAKRLEVLPSADLDIETIVIGPNEACPRSDRSTQARHRTDAEAHT